MGMWFTTGTNWAIWGADQRWTEWRARAYYWAYSRATAKCSTNTIWGRGRGTTWQRFAPWPNTLGTSAIGNDWHNPFCSLIKQRKSISFSCPRNYVLHSPRAGEYYFLPFAKVHPVYSKKFIGVTRIFSPMALSKNLRSPSCNPFLWYFKFQSLSYEDLGKKIWSQVKSSFFLWKHVGIWLK